jgi:putative NIF3 family GTP cyclohydrolase 1 type 2
MRASHPYEEIAYDLYEVKQKPVANGLVKGLGYGFWGEFPRERSFSEVSRGVKTLFKLDGFLATDPAPSRIRRIAFVAGKGASFLSAAQALQCDLFITGEAGYHAALGGSRQGTAVMELGHRESEGFFVPTVREWLKAEGIPSGDASRKTQRFY